MNKTIFILLLVLTFGCSEINRTDNLIGKIEKLQFENDSLKNILAEIDEKYVFDSLAMKQFPSNENSSKLNSLYKTEFVFVGYNAQSKIIFGDSITYEDGNATVVNGKELPMKKGSFLLERKLKSDVNEFWGLLKLENKYGRQYGGSVVTVLKTKKN